MTNTSSGARRALTRVLAAAALLAIYCVSTIAVTGVMMTSTVTSVQARGWGVADVVVAGARGRGWGPWPSSLGLPSQWLHQPPSLLLG